MASPPDRRERTIFEAALERPEADREDFLRQACVDAPLLAQRIQRLLAAHRRAEEQVPSGTERTQTRDPLMPLQTPERVGPYRLLEPIGEGGMGVVYVAEQVEPVRRKVALKLIKAGMDTREVIARFHSERQALALMNHPNIARILEAGATEEGRPYFVMEYVPGMPLIEYCDQQRLDVHERLRLFVDVCDAVQHAHQKGVIHRDLKPSNILVEEEDGRPIPKVIDFGIAKAIGQRLSELTVHTRIGGFIGTPEYVSPEQARLTGLDVDTRADVYSLGAVLYELLTGFCPFDFSDSSVGLIDMQTAISDQDPRPPSTRVAHGGEPARRRAEQRHSDPPSLARTLRHDLDWVITKTLEKDRNRRYSSASELAADIERFLARQPVSAGPRTARYRFGRFVRRHKMLLAAISLGVLLLVGGILGTSLGLIQARREAEKARVQTEISQEVISFLNDDLLSAVAPHRQGFEVSMREVLDHAAERIEGRFTEQSEVEAELRETISRTYASLGAYKAAEPHRARLLELRRALHGEEDPRTLRARGALGDLYRVLGRYAESEEILLGVLDIERRVTGQDSPETLSTLSDLAILYQVMGRYPRAEELFLEIIAARERLHGRAHGSTIRSIELLGILYQYMGRWEEAERLLLESSEFDRLHYSADSIVALNGAINLSALYLRQQRYPEAQKVLEESIGPMRRVLGSEHLRTLRMINNLGYLYAQQGRFDEAESLLLESLETKRRILGEEHPSTVEAIDSLMELYRNKGDGEKLAHYSSQYLAVCRKLAEAEGASLKERSTYARLLVTIEPASMRNPGAAVKLARDLERELEHDDAEILDTLARAYFQVGDTARAVNVLRRALNASVDGAPAFRDELQGRLERYVEASDG